MGTKARPKGRDTAILSMWLLAIAIAAGSIVRGFSIDNSVGVWFAANWHTVRETDVGGGPAGVPWMVSAQEALFDDSRLERSVTARTSPPSYPRTLSAPKARRCGPAEARRR